MAQFQLTFRKERETAGAIRYAEVLPNGELAKAPNDPGARVGTLYFRKTAFQGPDKLTITVEW